MEKINEDFNLGLSRKKIISRTELTPIRKQKKREFEAKVKKTYFQIHIRNWNKKDQEYWLQFGIDIKLLKKYNIFPVKKYYTKTKSTSGFLLVYNYDRDRNDPCYCYRIGEDDPNVKLYRPLAQDVSHKWRTNTTVNDVQGLDQLPLNSTNDTLIITSSMKDALTLVSVGYDAIAPQSEGVCIPTNIINKLKKKYKRIIFIYDSDETGHKYSKQHAELSNCEYCLLKSYNNQKDFADIRSVMSKEEFIQYVNNLIN
jgi:5S rRNA maturation endonuclease (ribonuclease M5)